VKTKRGEGKVIRQNILKKTLTVSLDGGEDVEISTGEIIREKPRPKHKSNPKSKPRSKPKSKHRSKHKSKSK
jgi:hypothetical protein